jgi:drug/metabolite transporter (DMT)-like permease
MLKGIGLKVAATFAFSLMSAMIKLASATFPASETVFFRSLFALVTLVAWLRWRGEFPHGLHTLRPIGHIGRSLAGSCGMFAGFVALSLLPLADATAFTFATPLMVVPLAAFVLGEDVRPFRWIAVATGFVGVLVMLSDHLGGGVGKAMASTGAGLGSIVALCGAVGSAVAMIQTRRLTSSETTGAIVFYFSSLTAAISAVLMLAAALWPSGGSLGDLIVGQRFIVPSPGAFGLLMGVGLLGGCGQILMTHSYRFADASIIAAFDYVAMIWAAALGFAVFGDAPSPRILAGAGIVAAAGVTVLWREHAARRIAVIEAKRPAGAPVQSASRTPFLKMKQP